MFHFARQVSTRAESRPVVKSEKCAKDGTKKILSSVIHNVTWDDVVLECELPNCIKVRWRNVVRRARTEAQKTGKRIWDQENPTSLTYNRSGSRLWKSFSFTFRNRANKIKTANYTDLITQKLCFPVGLCTRASGNKPCGVMRSWWALISLPHSKPQFPPVYLRRFLFSWFERPDGRNWRQTVGRMKTFQNK